MKRYIYSSIIVFASLLVFGCAKSESMYSIESKEAQKLLVASMKARGIPTRIEKDGTVWFPSKYEETVRGLAFDAMKDSKPSSSSSTVFRYVAPKYTELLIEKLKTNSVPFEIVQYKGEKAVSLSYKDESLWKPLTDEVDDLVVKDAVHGMERTHEN